MDGLEKELHDLAKAERDIAEGEERVTRLILLLDHLRRDGNKTEDAEQLLAAMQMTLKLFRDHRELILAEVERQQAKERG